MSQPVALITGAGRGIGRAAAEELARRGYRLALVSRTAEQLHETRQALATDAIELPADIRDPQQAESVVQRTAGAFGRLDALIHCAGLAPAVSVEQMTPDQWRDVLDTNLSSAFYLAHAAWPIFSRQNAGVIVNISSMASRDPFPRFAAYGAAKAGLNILSLALAREGAHIGVRVHTIAPGAVETAMFRRLCTEEQWPADKTLSPQEVAVVIAQCAVGELRYTSGEVIFLSKTLAGA